MLRAIGIGTMIVVCLIVCFTFIGKGSLIQKSYAAEVKGCYFCYWNPQFEMYECKIYNQEGGTGCTAQGISCTISGHCTM